MAEAGQRSLREVVASLESIEETALASHRQLDGFQQWALSTIDHLEHDCEYAVLELENETLADEIAEVMALVHQLYRRCTEHELVAWLPPDVLDVMATHPNRDADMSSVDDQHLSD